MNTKRYQDAIKEYKINYGDVLKYKDSYVACQDFNELPYFILNNNIDMVYSDLPWSLRNVNFFYGFANKNYINSYENYFYAFLKKLEIINPKVAYIEMGVENIDFVRNTLLSRYKYVNCCKIKYFKKHTCFLLSFSNLKNVKIDGFIDKDDTITPIEAIKQSIDLFGIKSVCDLCTGKGITPLSVHKLNLTFYGTEIIKEKLALFIKKADKQGIKYENI